MLLRTAVIAMGFLAAAARAEEGMWLPGQAPEIAGNLKAAGFELPGTDLADLSVAPLNAMVSLGYCSGAFLSPDGLIATNHHCVYGSIQYHATPARNYITDGFLAKKRADELPAADGTRAYVIEELRDVTREMLAGIDRMSSAAKRAAAIEVHRKALIAACEARADRRCDVRAYFGGATWYLQQEMEIRDVRLVYAPSLGIGNFGGEVDNWMWPRHSGDFGFYRAYVAPDGTAAPFAPENVPYRPKAWLKPSPDGIGDGDFVMVAGFPGRTERFRTAAEAKGWFETIIPKQQKYLADYADRIAELTANDPAAKIKYAGIKKGADNFKKKLAAQMAGAEAIALIDKKRQQEAEFRAWALGERARARLMRPVFEAVDRDSAASVEATASQVTRALLSRAQLLWAAGELYSWAREREKPDELRREGYQDRDANLFADRLKRIERQFDPVVDRALFEQALTEYRHLPVSERNAGLDRLLPQIGLDRIYAETALGDTAARLAWMDQPLKAFRMADDPFIRLAVAIRSSADDDADRRDADVLRAATARSIYMTAWRAYARATGKAPYPDANGSLRFSFGTVKARGGDASAAFTTVEEIVQKATGEVPFAAPERELDLIKAKDFGPYAAPHLGTLPVDFLSTVDITNGNSGSPTLDAKGRFVGIAFDGTVEGIISDWWFDPALNRTVHVDSRYMFWVMDKVDHATELLAEIGGN